MYKIKIVKEKDKEYQKKKEKFFRKIMKDIFSKTYAGTTIIFIALASIGKAQAKIFLKPSYYIDDPFSFLGDIEIFKQKKLKQENIRRSLKRLKDYGLVENRNNFFFLTKRGEKLSKKIFEYKKELESKWDGKYRVVIFDIPEIDRRHRDWLRGELHFLGYKKLQQSVFISKFSLTPDIIHEIKEREIDKGVNYLLVEHVYDLEKKLLK